MLRSIMILLQAVHEKQLVNEYTPKFGILSCSQSASHVRIVYISLLHAMSMSRAHAYDN